MSKLLYTVVGYGNADMGRIEWEEATRLKDAGQEYYVLLKHPNGFPTEWVTMAELPKHLFHIPSEGSQHTLKLEAARKRVSKKPIAGQGCLFAEDDEHLMGAIDAKKKGQKKR